ncbi:MAG: 50S ribosomal protein L4 [Candidatus Hadarchaeia archaeon]
MKANVKSVSGNENNKVDLPSVFDEDIRPDIVKRSVHSAQSSRKQPKGSNPKAGMETTAETPMKGSGRTRVRRVKGSGYHAAGRGAWAPFTEGGRAAHPPKSEKKIGEDINKREKEIAIRSAISATKDRKIVEKRGHEIDGVEDFPIIVEDDFEEIEKTREVKEVFENLGIWRDVERVKNGKKIRAGKGKYRGRKYKKRVGPLLVVSEDSGIFRGARNIPGVEITKVDQLNSEMLAPGGVLGRLTVWTSSAIDEIEGRFSN